MGDGPAGSDVEKFRSHSTVPHRRTIRLEARIFRNKILKKSIMDQIIQTVEPVKQFAKDSIRLVKRCTKPDKKEFQKIAIATAIGFAIMGFIGFFVKLIHIPINNIIVGS